jgi:tripartite-type tricarboxylate transporter receptor subunit TctC
MTIPNLGKRISLAITTVVCVTAMSGAQAAEYPEKPITVVVPYSPGGGVDIVTRIVTKAMSDDLKQPVIVDNRPGGGTNIGMGYAARGKPDGYTLYMASNTLTTNKALYSNLDFDPATAFTPIGKIGDAPLVVVVTKDSPFKTLGDLVEYGKQHSGELTFGTAGTGSSGHMASELLLRKGGFKALHVPYKGGSPAITDLLGGRLSFMAINPLEVISHIKSGSLRPLAVLNSKPTVLLPDLTTAEKAGVPDVDATVWWGLVAPAGTPDVAISKLNSALNNALKKEEIIQSLAKLGATPGGGTPAQFDAFIKKDAASMAELVKSANIKVD